MSIYAFENNILVSLTRNGSVSKGMNNNNMEYEAFVESLLGISIKYRKVLGVHWDTKSNDFAFEKIKDKFENTSKFLIKMFDDEFVLLI